MAAPREPLNKATLSVGFHSKFVTVRSVTDDGLYALTVDRQNTETRVPMLVQRSKGPPPAVGETWLIDQAMGTWTFAAFVAATMADFAGATLPVDASDLVFISNTPPANPAKGDLWLSGSNGNELFRWNGGSWAELQYGTQAIADGAITNAKLANGTVTAAKLSPAAGILPSQVAFTVNDLGGVKVFTGTSQPTGMASGDLWINPANGNALNVWNGSTWLPLQFGALALQPASITGAQISGAANIGPNQISFTARDIGGLTVSIAAAQPASPVIGDLWYDATNGYVLDRWNGSAWVPYQYGTNAIQAGSVTAALIAANTITAAQIAAGTITAAQIATGTITAKLLATVGTNDYNAFLAGGDSIGWIAAGGTFSVVTPAGAPYTNVAQISTDGVTATPAIENNSSGSYPVQPGRTYLVSALVYTSQSAVTIGADWRTSTFTYLSTATDQVTVTPNTWTFVYTIITAPASAGMLVRRAGLPGTPAAATILQATAIRIVDGFDGGVIEAGTITADQIAAGTITGNLIQAGTVVAGLLDADAIDGMTINGNTINGAVVSAADLIVSGADGGLFVYGSGGTIVKTYSASGTFTWTCPTGVTSVLVELWAGGAGGAYDATNFGGSGAGGAYAASTITVVPGTTYTIVVGAHGNAGTSGSPNGTDGGDSTWQSTIVIAKGGGGGTPSAAGTHKAGSVGTVTHQGGDGALGSSIPVPGSGTSYFGGGGGGSGGPNAPGRAGDNVANGGTAVSGGGPGGNGAINSLSPQAAAAPAAGPGGGGGGGCNGQPAGAAGWQGKARLTYTSATPALTGSVAGQAGTDPVAGTAYPEGAKFDNLQVVSGVVSTQPGTTDTPETWHSILNASLLNSWTLFSTGVGAFYKVNAEGDVEFYMDLVPPASPNTPIFTMPGGYPQGTGAQSMTCILVSGTGTASFLTPRAFVSGSPLTVQGSNIPSGVTRLVIAGKWRANL